jgi:hypothetical protein
LKSRITEVVASRSSDQFHRREAQLGFEDFFARLAAGGLGPHDPAALASFAARYRLEFLGPSPFAG